VPCHKKEKKCRVRCWASVAHACNPSYSGGRDQEDQGSKSSQANSLRDPILKKPITERDGGGEFKYDMFEIF
jgi:hypothetical protein